MAKIFFFILLCLLGMLKGSNAIGASMNIFIEPYLGYSQLSFTDVYGDGTPLPKDTAMAAVLGGKGGLSLKGGAVLMGLDYHTGGVYFLENGRKEVTQRMFGAGLGFQKGRLRVWGGYYPLNEIEDANLFTKYVGTALKLSLGFDFNQKISVNLEIIPCDLKTTESTIFPDSVPTQAKASVVYISFSSLLKF